MQLVCSAETKADELFLSGKLSESDALQARVLMGDLDIDVVRISSANNDDIIDAFVGSSHLSVLKLRTNLNRIEGIRNLFRRKGKILI